MRIMLLSCIERDSIFCFNTKKIQKHRTNAEYPITLYNEDRN